MTVWGSRAWGVEVWEGSLGTGLRLRIIRELSLCPRVWVPKPWNMALNEGIWDPKPEVTNISGTNFKSLRFRPEIQDAST